MNINEEYPDHLVFALTGWLVGAIAIIAIGLCLAQQFFPRLGWLNIIMVLDQVCSHIIGFGILLASPGGLVGGLIGSRIPREGGQTEQFHDGRHHGNYIFSALCLHGFVVLYRLVI